jgi:hypothetical protein
MINKQTKSRFSGLTGFRNRTARTDGFTSTRTPAIAVALMLLALALLSGCGGGDSTDSSTKDKPDTGSKPPTKEVKVDDSEATSEEDAMALLVSTYGSWERRISNFGNRAEAINYLTASEPDVAFIAIDAAADATADTVGIIDANSTGLEAATLASSGCVITLSVSEGAPEYSDCQVLAKKGDVDESVIDAGNQSGDLLVSGWSEEVGGTTLYTVSDAGDGEHTIGDFSSTDFIQEFTQGEVLYGTDNSKGLYSIDLDTGALTEIAAAEDICQGAGKGIYSAQDTTTAASVDGGRMAVLCGDGKTIKVMNLDGTEAQELVQVRPDELIAEVVSDGSTVFFSVSRWKNDKSVTNVWQVSVSGGVATQLSKLDGKTQGENAWINVGGGKIAVTRMDGIYAISTTGGSLNKVVSGEGLSKPRLNSDGTKLAYLDEAGIAHILDLTSQANLALPTGLSSYVTGLNWLPEA